MAHRRAAWDAGAGEPPFSSLDEVSTGQIWTDGKPIYRKGYTGTMANSNPEISINTSGLGIDQPVKMWGRLYKASVSSEDQYINFPGTENAGTAADMFIGTFRKSEVLVQCGSGSSTFDGDAYVLFIYYTKT